MSVRLRCCALMLSVVLAALWSVPPFCRADESAFVSGFERFARYAEIDEVTAGRLLLTELSCTRCHQSNDPELAAKGGPALAGAGLRFQQSWIRTFVADPARVHAGTTMPAGLASLPDARREQVAGDIAAFLATQKQPLPEIKASGVTPVPLEFWKRGAYEAGQGLYHEVGCVACHAPDPNYEVVAAPPSPLDKIIDQLDQEALEDIGLASAARPVASVPHPDLAKKYTLRGLTLFLLDPSRYRSGGRMPDLKLSPVEAADLARYLIDRDGRGDEDEAADSNVPIGDPAAGRDAFILHRCASCHQTPGIASDLEADAFPQLKALPTENPNGCLTKDHASGPAYALDSVQQEAILTALRAGKTEVELGDIDINKRLKQRLLQLNCYACHERDGRGGVGRRRKDYFHSVGHVDLGDEGRLPPVLSGVGRKMVTAWMERVLAGKNAEIRPHMTIRMPKYHVGDVETLPKWFAQVDAHGTARDKTDRKMPVDASDLVEAGRKLMDIGCVQCHQFDGFTTPGVVGVELAGVTQRVNREWFRAFMRNPAPLKPGTRMPNFFPGGKAQDTELLGGDPSLQIMAMWAYLENVRAHSLPLKIVESRSQTYELVPEDRPIVLRTFMPVAGTHAIAVGLPEKVHFAFDAEQLRLAIAWRGQFLDAQGTWFVRFAPPAAPLGKAIEFPKGPVLALVDQEGDAAESKFGGYKLDEAGVPTFLYRLGDLTIEDRTVADSNGNLRRTWRLQGGDGEMHRVAFAPLDGSSVRLVEKNCYRNELGLGVCISRLPGSSVESAAASVASDQSGHQRLIYEFEIRSPVTLEVTYSW